MVGPCWEKVLGIDSYGRLVTFCPGFVLSTGFTVMKLYYVSIFVLLRFCFMILQNIRNFYIVLCYGRTCILPLNLAKDMHKSQISVCVLSVARLFWVNP